MLNDIPPEIAFKIMFYLPYKDISNLRLVSEKIRSICDQPCFWRSICLQPPQSEPESYTNNHASMLWKLSDLQNIIDVHLKHIRSIEIWGVRDNIVHYLLSSCPNLQHLIIRGWTTLSDHCLRILSSQAPLKLKTLRLIGTSEQMNFVSVNACTLGKLLIQSPKMTDLVFHCEMHIHADTFLYELERKMLNQPQQQQQQQQRKQQHIKNCYDLKYLVLAARSAWLRDHVLRLIGLFPRIQRICLMSKLKNDYLPSDGCSFLGNDYSEQLDSWINEQLERALSNGGNNPYVITDSMKLVPLITTDDMIVYDRASL